MIVNGKLKIIVNDSEFILEPAEFDFMSQTFDLSVGNQIIEREIDLIDFLTKFKAAFAKFLNDSYSGYNERERSKHSTRFEKFIFEGKKYIVNYTTSPLQRLMYTLFLRIQLIENAIQKKQSIKIVFETGNLENDAN